MSCNNDKSHRIWQNKVSFWQIKRVKHIFLFWIKYSSFLFNLRLGMFLICSYFFRYLSLNLLISMVLTQQIACMASFISSPIKEYSLADAVMFSFTYSLDQLYLVLSFDLVRKIWSTIRTTQKKRCSYEEHGMYRTIREKTAEMEELFCKS